MQIITVVHNNPTEGLKQLLEKLNSGWEIVRVDTTPIALYYIIK